MPTKPGPRGIAVAVVTALVLIMGSACSRPPGPTERPTSAASGAVRPDGRNPPAGGPRDDPSGPSPRPVDPTTPAGDTATERVLVVSVDGLTPSALESLGPDNAPAIWSIIDGGLSTLNARTDVDYTITLPNHVSMVTGLPVRRSQGGHGVTWNGDYSTRTVQQAAGRPLPSIFSQAHAAGLDVTAFVGKSKLQIFERSWPESVIRTVVAERPSELGRVAAEELRAARSDLVFVHIGAPDEAGHLDGWGSPAYLAAVEQADRVVGRLQRSVSSGPPTTVVLTADHGGAGFGHGDVRAASSYTIPFAVAGPGVPAGDLYDLSPALTDPGGRRVLLDDPPPVRNCDVANVAAVLLDLPLVPGSVCRAATSMPLR